MLYARLSAGICTTIPNLSHFEFILRGHNHAKIPSSLVCIFITSAALCEGMWDNAQRQCGSSKLYTTTPFVWLSGQGKCQTHLYIYSAQGCKTMYRGIRHSPCKVRCFQNVHGNLGLREGLCHLHQAADVIQVSVNAEDV